jgi:AP endonuclease 2
MLKIATWNINGIRSFTKEKLQEALLQIDADIICLQETKITRKFAIKLMPKLKYELIGDVLDEQTATFDGFTSFFSFSSVRSGYSGKNLTS